MTTREGRLPCESVATISSTPGLGGEFNRRRRKAKPQGAQADLIDRLLAGNIDDAPVLRGKRGAGLDDQGRFADAGFAAKQKHRARHETAAGYPVEFGDAGGDTRGGWPVSSRSGSKGQKPGLFARAWRLAPMPDETLSSAIVFHPPQASQRPCQR